MLSVKVEPPAAFRQRFDKFCLDRFVLCGRARANVKSNADSNLRRRLLDDAVAEGYKRFGELKELH